MTTDALSGGTTAQDQRRAIDASRGATVSDARAGDSINRCTAAAMPVAS
jgi:hypothetical protein